MTVSLTVNGTTYFYPETGDTNWGNEATDWATAVTGGMLQKAGGLFTLLAEADFGATFGLKSIYYKSRVASPSTAGVFRLGNVESVGWRNFADSGNLLLIPNASNELTFNGSVIGAVVTVADTNSVDLTLDVSKQLTADLKLSAAAATASYQLVNLTTQSDGIKAEISNAAIVTAASTGNFITSLTGDVTASGPGAAAATIASGAVTLAKMANLAANSVLGNNTGSPATPIALTVTQTTAMLNAMVGDSGAGGTKGLVPAPSAGDAAAVKYLRADGTWATTPSGPSQATPTALGTVTTFVPVIASAIKTVSAANYTILTLDGYQTIALSLLSGANRTITLPATANNIGRRIRIVRTATDGEAVYRVIVAAAGSDVIYAGSSITATALNLDRRLQDTTLECIASGVWSQVEASGTIILAASLDSGFTSGSVYAIRIGNQITVQLESPVWTAGLSRSTSTAVIPSGFRPGSRTVFACAARNGSHGYDVTFVVETTGIITVQTSDAAAASMDDYSAIAGCYFIRF